MSDTTDERLTNLEAQVRDLNISNDRHASAIDFNKAAIQSQMDCQVGRINELDHGLSDCRISLAVQGQTSESNRARLQAQVDSQVRRISELEDALATLSERLAQIEPVI